MTTSLSSPMPALPDHAVHHPCGAARGITVFLLHGAFGAKEYWYYQTRALVDAGYRVVAWDAPGYGLSPLPRPFNIEIAAAALGRLIEHTGGTRNVLLGHSMGGMIAQRAYGLFPERVHGLVLSATSAAFGKTGGDWQQAFVRDRVAPLDAGQTVAELAPTMIRRMMAPGASGPAVDLVIQIVSRMREDTFRAAVQAITEYDGRDVLPRITVPTLCIAGEHDLLAAPPAVMEKMAGKIRGAQYLCTPGVSHFGWAEQPETFNRALLDFLAQRVDVAGR